MKRFILSLVAGLTALGMQAGTPYRHPLTDLWKTVPEETQQKKAPEISDDLEFISKVNNPTLEEFLPFPGNKNGKAVVVCPGGAYQFLSYIKEGQEVAQWLAGQGYTAYVLAYRVPDNRKGALQDIFRAIRMIRAKGFEQVGTIGFSAGASLSCRAATRWNEETYTPQDDMDKQNQRPDFAMLIYPAYLDEGKDHTLTPELTVTKETCPLFVFGTQDDTAYGAPSSITILQAMYEKGAPIELHFMVKGGHGYGLRNEGAGRIWPTLAEEWLKTLK